MAGQNLFYVDLLGTGNYVNTDPTYFLPSDMQLAPAASTTQLANIQALGVNGCVGFDSRGTVTYATCGAGAPVVWFISIGITGANSGYRAITITPMGQAKAWTASPGGIWNTM
jgi:hypothetical protein